MSTTCEIPWCDQPATQRSRVRLPETAEPTSMRLTVCVCDAHMPSDMIAGCDLAWLAGNDGWDQYPNTAGEYPARIVDRDLVRRLRFGAAPFVVAGTTVVFLDDADDDPIAA
ncbi:MAG: hypothetical protein AAFZ07_28365 [Actinomycetota bacterium]